MDWRGPGNLGYRCRYTDLAADRTMMPTDPADATSEPDLMTLRVWDLPTRCFHWALAVAVSALVITGHVGGNALVWHMRLGLAVLVLLSFRLLWGVIGGRWSRFSAFVRSPGALRRYLRGQRRGVGCLVLDLHPADHDVGRAQELRAEDAIAGADVLGHAGHGGVLRRQRAGGVVRACR